MKVVGYMYENEVRGYTLEHEDGRRGVWAHYVTQDEAEGLWIDGDLSGLSSTAIKAIRSWWSKRERELRRKEFREALGMDDKALVSDGSPYR